MFISPALKEKYTFLSKFSPKYQKCLFKIKFSTKTNLNMLNLRVMLRFSVFDWEYPSWANVVQNYKVV